MRVIAILGPTGSGKSDLALRLAAHLPIEIISVDSAQVYRGMNIGTAKPSAAEQGRVPHHLIDIREPEAVYSAGEFRDDALRLVDEIHSRKRIPVLVGGTMLYFRALFQGLAALPTADTRVRATIDASAQEKGWAAMHAELAERDPLSAAKIHPNDAQRIQRALEVLTVSGRSLRDHWCDEEQLSSFGDWTICVLQPQDRAQLHARLAQRLETMLSSGLIEEVRQLLTRATLDETSPALRLVGYRQLIGYVKGRESLAAASAQALYATRQLAKRQLTWLRSQSLLPTSASVLRCDSFDSLIREQLTQTLIQESASP
jgi:tRNA dimethylallyltransferase